MNDNSNVMNLLVIGSIINDKDKKDYIGTCQELFNWKLVRSIFDINKKKND